MALVIGLLTASLVLIAYHHRLYQVDHLLYKRARLNLQSGINVLLAGGEQLSPNEEKMLDLFGDGEDTVTLKKRNWGLFEIGTVKALMGRHSASRSFMYGYYPDKVSASALYLADNGRPLSVSGKTQIKGEAYVPAMGLRPAMIEGQNFQSLKMIEGKQMQSTAELPSLNLTILTYLQALLDEPIQTLSATGIIYKVIPADTLLRSFNDSTIIIFQQGAMSIGSFISGNVMLVSATEVVIESSANLEDIIVIAPRITVSDGFKGNLQLLASDSILIGKNCIFKYPSAAIIMNGEPQSSTVLSVGESTIFRGILLAQTEVNSSRGLITIGKDAEITGQVYSTGFVEVKGRVNGNITCKSFLLRTPSAVYENYLLDAVLDATRLPAYYVGSGLIRSKKEKRIAKWIN